MEWRQIESNEHHKRLFNSHYGKYLFKYPDGSVSLAPFANMKKPTRYLVVPELTPRGGREE